MSTIERHCQLLLRFYPAAYREVRGEEIIGTLLEATPPGRLWPRSRDIRGLIFGGLRARAALNRQSTTAANLRIAVLAGVAAYLACSAASFVSLDVMAELSAYGRIQPAPFGWPSLLVSALTLVAAGLALLTGRRSVVLAAALPAAAVLSYAGPWNPGASGTAFHLALLAALVALVGGSKRPSRRWLVLISLLAVLPVVPYLVPALGSGYLGVLLAVGVVSTVWAVIDARPAVAVIVFLLGFYLPLAVNEVAMGAIPTFALPYLGVVAVFGVPALWLLRRQSAHPSRPAQT
jgi:hypothetical protein